MRSSTSIRDLPEKARLREQTLLAFSFVGGALLFLLALEALYLSAYTTCGGGPKWPMHAVVLASGAGAGALAVWAWSRRGDTPTTEEAQAPEDHPVNWLARASALANAWFLLVILSTEIVITILNRCW